MATHCSMLAWEMPWTEEPDGLQSMESQRVRHTWVQIANTHTALNGSIVLANKRLNLKYSCMWILTHMSGEKIKKRKKQRLFYKESQFKNEGGRKVCLTWAITISHIKQNPKIDGNVYSSSWSWCACNRKIELWFSCEILGPRFPSGLNQSPVRGQDAEQGA